MSVNDYFYQIIEPNWNKIKDSLYALKKDPNKIMYYWETIYNQILDFYQAIGITFRIANDGQCRYFIE